MASGRIVPFWKPRDSVYREAKYYFRTPPDGIRAVGKVTFSQTHRLGVRAPRASAADVGGHLFSFLAARSNQASSFCQRKRPPCLTSDASYGGPADEGSHALDAACRGAATAGRDEIRGGVTAALAVRSDVVERECARFLNPDSAIDAGHVIAEVNRQALFWAVERRVVRGDVCVLRRQVSDLLFELLQAATAGQDHSGQRSLPLPTPQSRRRLARRSCFPPITVGPFSHAPETRTTQKQTDHRGRGAAGWNRQL